MNLITYLDGSIDQSGKTLLLDHYMGLGDALWRTCLHREIKRRNPKLKLIVTSRGNSWRLIYANSPYIDELRDPDQNGQPILDGVDYYLSDQLCLHVISNYSRDRHAIDALEIFTGLTIYDKSYWYQVTKEENEFAEQFLLKVKRPIVGVVLKSSTWVRTWPLLHTKKLIKMILHAGGSVIIFDNNQVDLKHENIINMAGGYNIREVAAVVSKLNGLVAPDSGILHFGGHFRIPTVGIFGAVPSSCRIGYYSTVVPAEVNLPCRPCFVHAFYCKYGVSSPCLTGISVEMVWDKLKSFNIL